jgi:hypothetical protein
MGSFLRKLKRKQKKDAEKELKRHLSSFDKMGGECSACEKPFDKKSKEHAKTWNVIVRKEESIVRLYCPGCWGLAKEIIEHIEKTNDN